MMKFFSLFLLFLSSTLFANSTNCEQMPQTFLTYRIKDIGETAYFLIEKLRCNGILARTIIIYAKTNEILSDKTTAEFIHTPKTERAYCKFVEPFKHNQIPSSDVLWYTLVDAKNRGVHICTLDAHGNYVDLRPYFFPHCAL